MVSKAAQSAEYGTGVPGAQEVLLGVQFSLLVSLGLQGVGSKTVFLQIWIWFWRRDRVLPLPRREGDRCLRREYPLQPFEVVFLAF